MTRRSSATPQPATPSRGIRKITLGLCCLNNELRKRGVYPSRTITLKKMHETGVEEVRSRVLKNLQDTLVMLQWNHDHGIKTFRLTSDLFPQKSNPNALDYGWDFAQPLLTEIGQTAKRLGIRCTAHPGQYNVVGSPNRSAFEATVRELDYHAELFDRCGFGKDSVLVIHGGGLYGCKASAKERWVKQYWELPQRVRDRLVLEHCEKCFSIDDVLDIAAAVGDLPVVWDSHHFECYKELHPAEKFEDPECYMERVLRTWLPKGIKPKMHVSEQAKGKRCGAHSDYINNGIPQYMLELPQIYPELLPNGLDIMVEAKQKECAVLRLRELHAHTKYPVQ